MVLKQHFSDEAAYISFTKEHADIAAFVRWPEAMFLDKFVSNGFRSDMIQNVGISFILPFNEIMECSTFSG